MKSKIVVALLTMLTVVSIAYGYIQRKEAEFQRQQSNEMHREVVRLKEESEAARMEAAKFRSVAEKEKQRADEAIQKLESKTKK
jgi:hypothetical protein